MRLCGDGHSEVCYEDFPCPLCEVKDEKEQEINELKERINVLETKLEEAQSQD